MTKNKHFRSVFAALLCAVLCMTAFATVAYADGGDYYDDELPPETWQEETQPEDNTIVPGTPFTEDGIAAIRDLLYDKHTNKQFITVETRNGHTLYIVIDYNKLLDEEEERYQTYFLNPVDEADLMALLEDDSQNTPVVCSCTEKCTAGKVNTNCALCKTDMTNCAGKEATPEETEQPDELTPEQITKLQQEMAQSWHLDKSRPYPAYMLSNNNAEIRRIRGRIEQVRQHEDTNFAGWEFDGGRVEANKADNRLQVFFGSKPDEAARDELKANGFRWAPSVGAWQRQLNKNAYYAAGYISCIQPISGEKPIDVQRSAQQQESAVPDGHLTGERVSTPRGSFHIANMTREQMEAAGYGYHHSTDDGKYLIMGNGTQAFAITAEQREQENYMRTAELSTEQNYNMIDGQINNTPSVDELEEKAKRGEVISLSALAAAVKAEDGRTPQRDPDGKKPSIRAQLKADRAQSCKPQQREKEQEAKRSIRQALEME